MGHEVARGVYRHHRSLESKGTYMKKILILSLIFFTTDSFASGIASNTASAPCTNNTLETYSGNSNLSADWQPNEIKLRWYNNNTLMDVQTAANTCTYDGTLAVPSTAPTRTGYTFDGWTVRPEIDFATTIPTNENGTERWAIGVVNDSDYCWYQSNTVEEKNVVCGDDSNFKELSQYEWKVKFDHGSLYGMAGCSTTNSSWGRLGNPVIEPGPYCWCKTTGYKAADATNISRPSVELSWVFDDGGLVSFSNCKKFCATFCANYIKDLRGFRSSILSPAN